MVADNQHVGWPQAITRCVIRLAATALVFTSACAGTAALERDRRSIPMRAAMLAEIGFLPPALIGQLKPRGRLVMPIGTAQGAQQRTVITRDAAGKRTQTSKRPVRCVPLTGDTAEDTGHH